MSDDRFSALLSVCVESLIQYMIVRDGISERDALAELYSSELYALLEQERTKLWHYSTETLYCLLREERETGRLTFPDV